MIDIAITYLKDKATKALKWLGWRLVRLADKLDG